MEHLIKQKENEVTELPNLADVTRIDIRVDGERFSLEFGETKEYIRQLNLKTAELNRSLELDFATREKN